MGNLIQFEEAVRDLNGQSSAEQQISALQAELKLQSTRLAAANQELETFSYSVSHDLRAPLRHIDGFVALLLKQDPETRSEKEVRYLKIIADSARQMGRLMDDLLSFSRLNRGDLQPTQFGLAPMVQAVIDSLKPDIADRQINWDIDPLPEVIADQAMLKRVWHSLICNAVKYTRPRAPAEIKIGAKPGEPGELVFFVQDNGVGFDMQYANKLFGVFQRLHPPDQFEGSGMGLANVRRLISRHGGRTWAEAKVDTGATFYFTLPSSMVKTSP